MNISSESPLCVGVLYPVDIRCVRSATTDWNIKAKHKVENIQHTTTAFNFLKSCWKDKIKNENKEFNNEELKKKYYKRK